MDHAHEHGFLPGWFEISSAVLLTLLLINSFYQQYKDKKDSKNYKTDVPAFSLDVPAMVIGVEGMTCEHCKAKVENGLRSQKNISNAIADLENNTVKLYGSNLNLDEINKVIHDLGYSFNGKI